MKQFVALFVFALLLPSNCHSQVIPKYDLGGASKPKPQLDFKKENQYKRVHQSSLRFILRGELEKTETFLNSFLKRFPDDPESLYMLGLLHAQREGEEALQKSELLLAKSIEAGLPEGRLIAGPRKMIEPLADSDLIKGLHKKFANRLVHGPLAGNISGTSASFWVRTATEVTVSVEVENVATGEKRLGETVQSTSTEDYTAVAKIAGLQPNSEYKYSILIDGKPAVSEFEQRFRTLAEKGKPSKFTIAFGGGAGYVPQNERMWDTIGSFDPDAILLLGDNVYIDDPESVVMQQYTYQRRQSRPEWRRLTARSPVFTIWDDHDFGTNDSWGGPDIAIPFWKKDWVFPIFRQNWANPGYGGGDDQPGCWYSFHIGDVDFIMLDCRYYRMSPKIAPRSMLGTVQKKWLKEQLASAKGTFKVICSSVPWDFRTKGGSKDTWNGYKKEHNEIMRFIESNEIEGVVLMSADRHRSDCWKIERPDGYDLYEFNSSRLTNQHIHPTMEKQGAIFSYNKPQSFGLVTFDTTLGDPTATYEVVNIDGEKPHSITVKRSQLKKD
ncbi:MAG: alkaline phosphatase [Mariniblastus sp.]